jgi:acyl CoA:acetate/3-ketoacid CoA transferase alpha subunit
MRPVTLSDLRALPTGTYEFDMSGLPVIVRRDGAFTDVAITKAISADVLGNCLADKNFSKGDA